MKMAIPFTALALLGWLSTPSIALPVRNISSTEAAELVRTYVKSRGVYQKLPGLALEHGTDTVYPKYYLYELLFDNPEDGSAVVNNYLVDKVTGDIWDGTSCIRYNSPALRAAQRRIWAKLHFTSQDYRRSARPGPGCE